MLQQFMLFIIFLCLIGAQFPDCSDQSIAYQSKNELQKSIAQDLLVLLLAFLVVYYVVFHKT